MPKGPLGAPRPFSEYRLIINPHERTADLIKVGPLGGPRPLAKNNPPVEDEEVAECMLTPAANRFGAGVLTRGETSDIEDLPPEAQQQALELAEKWCRGSKEAQAIEEMEEGQAIPALSRLRKTLSGMTGNEDDISIEVVDTPDASGFGTLGGQ